MNKKLQKAMRRQTELTAKLMAGNITKEEKTELSTVNAQIKKAIEPHKVTQKTNLTTMKLSEFREWVEKLTNGDPSADELAIIKYNLEQIKGQGVTDPDGIVAVQILAKETNEEAMSRLEARVAELEERLSEGGVQSKDANGDSDQFDSSKDDKNKTEGESPTAMALAIEALDATIKRFQLLRQKFEEGNVTLDDVYNSWPEYEIREIVASSAQILSKFDDLKTLLDEVVPKLKVAQEEADKEDEQEENSSGDDSAEDKPGDDSENEDGDEDEGDEEKNTEKSDDLKRFLSGQDMSPTSEGGTSDYQMLKRRGPRDRTPGTAHRG